MASKQRSKFVIQPFKTSVPQSADFAHETWKTLEAAIDQIQKKNASSLSFEELYRFGYNMVLHKHGEILYSKLEERLRSYLKDTAQEVASTNDHDLLPILKEKWEDHKTSSGMIRDILMYMDRTYVPRMRKAAVYDLALQLFRDEVVKNQNIRSRVQQQLLGLVRSERQGEVIQKDLVRAVTQMLMELGNNVYAEEFERPLLEDTAQFYRIEAEGHISICTCPEYLRMAHKRITQEQQRVHDYLDKSSEEKIRSRVERELIQVHMKKLVENPESGFIIMLSLGLIEELKLMYQMFSRVQEGLETLRTLMRQEVERGGKAIVTDQEVLKDPVDFVTRLLDLKDRFHKIVVDAFNEDRTFQHALSAAFEVFVNLEPRSPEFLSLFIDDCLKRGLKGKNDEEIEIMLDKVMILFRFLQDRDVFERYYKSHLAKRLLLSRSLSDDSERSLIQKLKVECGNQFTTKIEGMFKDIQISRELASAYSVPSGSFELIVNVLTKGVWPVEVPCSCLLPAQLERACEQFKKFYLSKHTGRCLTWHTSLGTAELRARFTSQEHELSVNTHQMMILLLFNDRDHYPFQVIASKTQIPIPELKRQLQSLACAKTKVLLKEPKGKDVDDSDQFSFNADFTSRLVKVKIATLSSQKETESQNKETRTKVDDDRKHQIEAAIVRVMKSRKVLEHNNLIAEVVKLLQTRFKPNTNFIKTRIESLIERDFLERSQDNMRTYHYLA